MRLSARMDPAVTGWEARQITHDERGSNTHTIDVARGRYPYSIVWTALPGITWLFPFIGHMGITDSRGVVYDFAGPYHIGVDDLAFGAAIRYIQLDPSKARKHEGVSIQKAWDSAVDAGCDVYCTRMHNIWYVIFMVHRLLGHTCRLVELWLYSAV